MLTQDEIGNDANEFDKELEKLRNIPGSDVDSFQDWLKKSDFYTAPATTQYHASYDGGLVEHELNVLDIMRKLASEYAPGKYSDESITVVALCHDLYKVGFYEPISSNRKHYYDGGSKKDAIGNFDWTSSKSFGVKNVNERFAVGDNGFCSCLIASRYFPLTDEEMTAIQSISLNDSGYIRSLSEAMDRYTLAVLLKAADMMASFVVDGKPETADA